MLNLLSNALKFTFEGAHRRFGLRVERRRRRELDGQPTPAPASPRRSCRSSSSASTACRARARAPTRARASGSRSWPSLSSCTAASVESERGRRGHDVHRSHSVRQAPTCPRHVSRASRRRRRRRSAPRPFVAEAMRWLPAQRPRRPPTRRRRARRRPPRSRTRASSSPTTTPTCASTSRGCCSQTLARRSGGGRRARRWRRRAASTPDLVLTDVMMPVLDGFGLLARAARRPVTGVDARHDALGARGRGGERRGLEAGADDYLVKPFSARELLARVSTHLQLHRSREHLDLALKGANLATWDWNVQTGEFIHNARWAELRGYAPDELPRHVRVLVRRGPSRRPAPRAAGAH